MLRSALPSAARWLEPPARISRTLYTPRIPVADIVQILPFRFERRRGPVRWFKLKDATGTVSCYAISDMPVVKRVMSFCPHVSSMHNLGEFSRNLVLGTFIKTCQEISRLAEIGQKYQEIYMKK